MYFMPPHVMWVPFHAPRQRLYPIKTYFQTYIHDIIRTKKYHLPIWRCIRCPWDHPLSTVLLHGLMTSRGTKIYIYTINIFADVTIAARTTFVSQTGIAQRHFINTAVVNSIVIYVMLLVSDPIRLTIPDPIQRVWSDPTHRPWFDSAFPIQFHSEIPHLIRLPLHTILFSFKFQLSHTWGVPHSLEYPDKKNWKVESWNILKLWKLKLLLERTL